MAASEVLDKRVAGDEHGCRAVAFEAAHGPQPSFQSTVICLDAVVGVLRRVVTGAREQVVDGAMAALDRCPGDESALEGAVRHNQKQGEQTKPGQCGIVGERKGAGHKQA